MRANGPAERQNGTLFGHFRRRRQEGETRAGGRGVTTPPVHRSVHWCTYICTRAN